MVNVYVVYVNVGLYFVASRIATYTLGLNPKTLKLLNHGAGQGCAVTMLPCVFRVA